MNRVAVGLLVSAIVAGNIVTITLLIGGRGSDPASGAADVAVSRMLEATEALERAVDRLSAMMRTAPPPAAAPDAAPPVTEGGTGVSTTPADAALGSRVGEVIERLDRLEKALATMKDTKAELAAAELRKERQEEFRSEDGFLLADELLAQKQFAVGANGILSFLEAHPDHPDTRDLLKKARDAFLQAGYGEKALWLHDEIMKKYPEHRGQDLYSLAMLERKLKKYEDARRHIDESIELATTNQERLNRLFYQAYLIHLREGDAAGLDAYREVERLASDAGTAYPGEEAGKRASEIEARLASR